MSGMTPAERRERVQYCEDDLVSRIENYLRQTVTAPGTGLPDEWWLQDLAINENTGFIEARVHISARDDLGNVKTITRIMRLILSLTPTGED